MILKYVCDSEQFTKIWNLSIYEDLSSSRLGYTVTFFQVKDSSTLGLQFWIVLCPKLFIDVMKSPNNITPCCQGLMLFLKSKLIFTCFLLFP